MNVIDLHLLAEAGLFDNLTLVTTALLPLDDEEENDNDEDISTGNNDYTNTTMTTTTTTTTTSIDKNNNNNIDFHPRIVFSTTNLDAYMQCNSQVWLAVRNRLLSLLLLDDVIIATATAVDTTTNSNDDDDDDSSNDAATTASIANNAKLGGPPPGSRKKIFFFCGTPTEKASREGQRFRKTEVAESPIPSHTDVVADHAQRTNCILLHVGISTCLDVGACRILMRMRLRWRNFDSP